MTAFVYEVSLPTGEVLNGALKECKSMNHALEILMHLEPDAERVTVRRVNENKFNELQAFRSRNSGSKLYF